MNPNNKRYSISAQFFLLLLSSGAFCVLLFFALHWGIGATLNHYFINSDFEDRTTEQRIIDFQEYVTDNQLTVGDTQAISAWTRGKPLILMEIYRSNVLVYSSYAPQSQAIEENDQEVPYYDWVSYYVVEFADGSAEVLLYCDDIFRIFTYATIGEVIFCTLLFLVVFLISCQGIVRYIRQLKGEIQAMEAGDLNTPITIAGKNDLTSLAESLDAMRIALRTQQDQTAWTYAANQTLISEMSHDLRTPLTTLLLYTEIVRSRKYENDAQKDDYLNKIDTKARQLKQLSDNLFEYALVTRDTVVTLDPPAYFSRIFEEPLAEMVDTLQQRGFACALDLGSEDLMLTVKMQYIRRVFDNITSNAIKYADPGREISVTFRKEEKWVGLRFANHVLPGQHREESTQVGLTSIETMMEKMNAVCRVEQGTEQFAITLLFPIT